MLKFIIIVDGAKPYRIQAFNAFEAWETAFKNHPDAGRVEVLPVSIHAGRT